MSFADTLKRFVFKKPADTDPQRLSGPMAGSRRNRETENPYLAARRTWNNHDSSLVSSRQAWQVIGILSLMIALAGVGGIIHIGSQSKFIPYIVQVDKLGQSVAYGRADRAGEADQRVIAARIASFIADARVVTPDVKLQRDAVFRTYSVLAPNDPSTKKMNEWLNGDAEASPFKRAAKETVSIEIRSVMPQTAETWQVDWVETTRDRQGVKKSEGTYRALVTVYQAEPNINTKEEEMWMNPIRLFVRDFTWSKQI